MERSSGLASPRRPRPWGRAGLVLASLVMAATLAGCAAGVGTARSGPGGTISVVAAENFWGSIATQLGGDRVTVKSVITNPDTDPHSYEASAQDGRTFATAQFVIVNGVGYDPWTQGLLAANPATGRIVLNVGKLVGIPVGRQPAPLVLPRRRPRGHRADHRRLPDASTPADAAYFEAQERSSRRGRLAPYDKLLDEIKAKYAGTPIGASESIVTPLAAALGLHLHHARDFLDAISEGNDPTAADKATIDPRSSTSDQDLRLQQPELHARRPAQVRRPRPVASRSPPSPRPSLPPTSRSRTGRCTSSGHRGGTAQAATGPLRLAACGRVPTSGARAVRRRGQVGGRTLWSGVDLTVGAGEFVCRARPQRGGQVDPGQGPARPAPLGRRRRSGCSALRARPAQRPDRLPAAAAQLRRRPAHPRASTWSGSASTATAGVCRCPVAAARRAGAAAARGSTR